MIENQSNPNEDLAAIQAVKTLVISVRDRILSIDRGTVSALEIA